jgi:hypothetical protein
MAFGSIMEMKLYMGEDEAVNEDDLKRNSSGGIVVESLIMIRIVASLSVEQAKSAEYAEALDREATHPYRTAYLKGFATGIGQFIQMWGM